MKHIKENKRPIGEKVKWLTDNPDEIIEVSITARTIKLKELRNRKASLEALISIPVEDMAQMELDRATNEKILLQAELQQITDELASYG